MSKISVIVRYDRDDGVIVPEYGSLTLKNRYTMMYDESVMKLLIQLDKASINLLSYILSKHGESGEFNYNRLFVDRFGEFMKENGREESYHRGTVDACMRDLKKHGVILRTYKGVYEISPKYFSKKDPKLREKRLKDMYAKAANIESMDIDDHNLEGGEE